jgi:phage-related minor tail protein
MVDGTKSVKDAFRSMAADIVKELYRVLVVQRLVGAISGSIGMFSGASTGSLGLPFGLATGGSMMPGKSYLVGENGPELVIPRHSGTVVNANQTAGTENGSGTVVVNNSFNFSANGDESVKRIIKQQIPSITEATKAAVVDAKLRGGSYGKAFR